MKLSMSLIAKYLSRYRMETHIQDDEMQIRGVRFLSDPRLSLSPEYVYLGHAGNYFSDERYTGACLIVNSHSRILCYDCDYEELLNDLIAAFEFYNDWERKLWQLASRNAPMQKILDAALTVLDAPSLVSDMDGNVLAIGHVELFPSVHEIEYVAETRKFAANHFNQLFIDSHGKIAHDITEEPRRYYSKGYGSSAITSYLTQDGERLAFAMIFDREAISEYLYLQTMEILLPFLVQSEELSGGMSGIRSNHSIISRLLNGETVAPQALDKFRESAGMEPPWQLLILQNLSTRNYTQRSLLVRDLNGARIGCFALEYEGDVLVLLNANRLNAVLREFSARLGLHNLIVGASMPVQVLTDLPVACRQAKFALGYQKGPGVYPCREYALQYLLSNLQGQDMVTELLHPAISALEQYDRENQTQLLQTLRVYMQEDRNQIETAGKLHTHRNTVKYRLERIDQLTGIDFSNWQERCYLNLSLLLSNRNSM